MKLSFLLKITSILLWSFFFMTCKSDKKPSNSESQNTTSTSSFFEGEIMYDMTYQDKKGALPAEQAKMFMGTKQKYTIKGNKYKSEMDGMMKLSVFYLGGDTLFNHVEVMNSLMWMDATTYSDKIISHEIKKNAETINGINCDLLTIKSEEGTTQYFFNKDYSVDPTSFAKHEFGLWKFCTEKTGAVPLKMISDWKDVYVEIIANEIKEMKIDDEVFKLPNLPRVKSPEIY